RDRVGEVGTGRGCRVLRGVARIVLPRRVVALGGQTGGVRDSDLRVLRGAGGDVVREGVVDNRHARGVVEHHPAGDVGRTVVDDHVVADVDALVEGVEHEDAAAVVAGV